jgi:hypothetical protein
MHHGLDDLSMFKPYSLSKLYPLLNLKETLRIAQATWNLRWRATNKRSETKLVEILKSDPKELIKKIILYVSRTGSPFNDITNEEFKDLDKRLNPYEPNTLDDRTSQADSRDLESLQLGISRETPDYRFAGQSFRKRENWERHRNTRGEFRTMRFQNDFSSDKNNDNYIQEIGKILREFSKKLTYNPNQHTVVDVPQKPTTQSFFTFN